MNYMAAQNQVQRDSNDRPTRVVIIGGGPVGMRLANDLAEVGGKYSVTVFSDEQASPYNRARLSQLLAGQIERQGLDIALVETSFCRLIHRAIVTVDPVEHNIIDSSGVQHQYDELVFATGARAFVPSIPGVSLSGVFQFRSLRNTENLLARKVRTRHVVVVGGGLLGVETAVAMNRFQSRVSLVHQSDRLLNRQIDQEASTRLEQTLESQGISVFLGKGVRALEGKDDRVQSVRLRDGLQIECDTVILCCGSSPNIEIARQANIRVNRGIVVTDDLRTSAANVYAIGECCEHADQVYGLISPGYDQAKVLANRLQGGDAVYTGSIPQSLLKVLDFPLQTFGEPVDFVRSPYIRETVVKDDSSYLKVVTSQGRILGAIGVGSNEEFDSLYDLYKRSQKLPWIRRASLRLFGRAWPLNDQDNPANWFENRMVCQCQQVTLQSINQALETGATTLSCLGSSTSAGITCGSCQPILAQILSQSTGKKTVLEPEPLFKSSLAVSIVAALLAVLMLLMPGLQVGDSITDPALLETIWNDKFWKQVTGFTLLGVTAVGLLVSLRKRLKWLSVGGFAYWRFAHVGLGALCAAVLILHTGLHTGENLNRWLVLNFITVLMLGALTSSVIAFSHQFVGRRQRLVRKSWNWLHIIATWPLPMLLIAHIITVYKY